MINYDHFFDKCTPNLFSNWYQYQCFSPGEQSVVNYLLMFLRKIAVYNESDSASLESDHLRQSLQLLQVPYDTPQT